MQCRKLFLATAILLQNFDFSLDDPSYELKIQQALSIKPKGFYMRASLRKGMDATTIEKKLHGNAISFTNLEKLSAKFGAVTNEGDRDLLTILYGSNSGTCEALAQSLARIAGSLGYEVRVDTLDSATRNVPKGHPVILLCPSYEGQPPDNAVQFFSWLESSKDKKGLSGVHFAVFGVGNRKS